MAGCGKSTIGNAVASRFNLSFIDTDLLIEKEFDMTLENIKKEVLEAKKTFQKYRWPLIDVTRKSVEETAASIIKIHEIYLNNVK